MIQTEKLWDIQEKLKEIQLELADYPVIFENDYTYDEIGVYALAAMGHVIIAIAELSKGVLRGSALEIENYDYTKDE